MSGQLCSAILVEKDSNRIPIPDFYSRWIVLKTSAVLDLISILRDITVNIHLILFRNLTILVTEKYIIR